MATGADAGGPPLVRVFDAATGTERFTFLAYDSNFTGGVRVALGDVNGDGITDIVTAPGAGGGPLVKVFSGADGSLLVSFNAYAAAFQNGLFVAVGDVNRDGLADIITGPDAGGGPLVSVFSGRDASLLSSFNAYDIAFHGGVRVAAGDLNGDGFADIITAPGAGGGPLVKVFSGKDGTDLMAFNAYDAAFPNGLFVAVGDVNGDGRPDIVTAPGVGGGPLVRVSDGRDGTNLVSFNAYDLSYRGGTHVAVADLTGDGRAEIIVGTGAGSAPHARVLDAMTLAELDSFFAYDRAFGLFVAGK